MSFEFMYRRNGIFILISLSHFRIKKIKNDTISGNTSNSDTFAHIFSVLMEKKKSHFFGFSKRYFNCYVSVV